MGNENGRSPAFAAVSAVVRHGDKVLRYEQEGLSKREYFAVHMPAPDLSKLTQAACREQGVPEMPGSSNRGAWELWRDQVSAILRVRQADALLAALENLPIREIP